MTFVGVLIFLAIAGFRRRPGDNDEPYYDGHRFDRDPEPVDDEPVKSCTMLAVMADGKAITTVEGLAKGGELDPVQQGFMECHGLQCGYCTPGMMMAARALLDRNPHPSEEEIREGISGNICRCTGYKNIVAAIQWAAENPATSEVTA